MPRQRRAPKAKPEQRLRDRLDKICASCGYSKGLRPPPWCGRNHPEYDRKREEFLRERGLL